jgi:hypothetical protein
MKLAADATERQRLAEELQRYLTEHMYWVSVSGSPHYKVHRKPVQNFHFQAEFKFLLEQVWLNKEMQGRQRPRPSPVKRSLTLLLNSKTRGKAVLHTTLER